MNRRGSRVAILATALALAAAPGPLARAQAIGQGFELERAGRHAEAAGLYLATLRADPANLPALLGLERVLPPLGRVAELLPLVQRARAHAPTAGSLRGLELRVLAELREDDSLEAAALRWAAAVPRSESPYREWAVALADRRAFDQARRVLLLGRQTLGGEAALAIELADLEERVGNWEAAAREWGRAVTRAVDMLPNASSHLSEAPVPQRDRVIRAVWTPDGSARARRLAAELLLLWGRPLEGWAMFAATLQGAADAEMAAALRRYADLAGAFAAPEARRVQGYALRRWADLVPAQLAGRARAEAVRALLDGGDRAAAREVLERLAGDSQALPDASGLAEAALLEVLIADGQLDAAERRLADERRPLSADDRAALRFALAQARITRGELGRAAAALGDDSSVAALAQRGWIALYRGALEEARVAFRTAGPYAGDRAAATDRTAMLALLQQVRGETHPELGAALLLLARGDSAGAVAALQGAAARLPADGGRLDVLLLAGQAAAGLGGAHETTAAALFAEIARRGAGGGAAAAGAELAWARLLVRQGRAPEAIERLEHLILTHPGSAFVPQARRELERARGAIPRS